MSKVNLESVVLKAHREKQVNLVQMVHKVQLVLLAQLVLSVTVENLEPMELMDSPGNLVSAAHRVTPAALDSMVPQAVLEKPDQLDTRGGWVPLETVGRKVSVAPKVLRELGDIKVQLAFLVNKVHKALKGQ